MTPKNLKFIKLPNSEDRPWPLKEIEREDRQRKTVARKTFFWSNKKQLHISKRHEK